jgi:CheY-like chemotaxis protein
MNTRILIVDDEGAFTRLLKMSLEARGGYEVRIENAGARAVAVAREFRPDLVLLDVVMPDIDGSRVAAQLHAEPGMEALPIVFLTAIVSRTELPAQGGVVGGHPFLAKPVTADEVIRCIEQHLRPATMTTASLQAAKTLPE